MLGYDKNIETCLNLCMLHCLFQLLFLAALLRQIRLGVFQPLRLRCQLFAQWAKCTEVWLPAQGSQSKAGTLRAGMRRDGVHE